ncbi:MAG: response regulator transcription factor [Chryseobacterium sp.]|nr:MAG: response regulator transcription factor [Chryseobacterium sp.]
MIDAIIIDDEAHSANALKVDLQMYCPEINVMDIAHSGIEGIRKIKSLAPQVIFLDVEMRDMNGFEMLEILGDLSLKVIFTTAYNQFAVRALRINALDYLLKPIDEQELQQAVERLKSYIYSEKSERLKLENLMVNIKLPVNEQKLTFPNRDGFDFISPNDILYCKADGAYTEVHLMENRTLLLSKSLGEIESMLPESLFLRIHHSYLVNLQHITQLKKSDGSFVVMSNGDHVSIARARKDDLFRRIGLLANK